MADRVRTESSDEVEVIGPGRSGKTPKVLALKDALAIACACATLFGGIVVFSIRGIVRDEIGIHNRDVTSHPVLRTNFEKHAAKDEVQRDQDRELMERIARIEVRQIQMSDSVSRIDERLKGMDRRAK